MAARWGEQGAGPAYQSEVGSALRGLESEREVGEGADARAPCDREREGGGTGVGWSRPGRKSWAAALVWAGLLGCLAKRGKVERAGSLGLTVGLGFGFLFLWVFSSFLFQTSLN